MMIFQCEVTLFDLSGIKGLKNNRHLLTCRALAVVTGMATKYQLDAELYEKIEFATASFPMDSYDFTC
jgi:hypothetical protein